MDYFEYEEEKLKDVLSELSDLKKRLEQISRYYGKDIVEQALDDQRQHQLKSLKRPNPSPILDG